jgi:hypothetical protein
VNWFRGEGLARDVETRFELKSDVDMTPTTKSTMTLGNIAALGVAGSCKKQVLQNTQQLSAIDTEFVKGGTKFRTTRQIRTWEFNKVSVSVKPQANRNAPRNRGSHVAAEGSRTGGVDLSVVGVNLEMVLAATSGPSDSTRDATVTIKIEGNRRQSKGTTVKRQPSPW